MKILICLSIILLFFSCQSEIVYSPWVGNFELIYDPSVGEDTAWYINDHTFVYGADDLWHMFGITHAEPANPLDEIHFAHATAKKLNGPWEKQKFAMTIDTKQSEKHLWAPYVLSYEGVYYMYYCAGDTANDTYRMHLAISDDLWNWSRFEGNPLFKDGYDARDPFILKVGNQWVMYYTATDKPAGGHHIVAYRTSEDLLRWSDRSIAYQDSLSGTYGGPCESPYVQKYEDKYFLFLSLRSAYARSEVLVSEDPFHWEIENKVLTYPAHASEVIEDLEGNWYVSHCGWGQGGLYLAPFKWNDL